jgi:hypothetical protein
MLSSKGILFSKKIASFICDTQRVLTKYFEKTNQKLHLLFYIFYNAFGMKQLSTPQLHLEWALTFETPCSSSITLHVTLLKKHQYIIIINKTLFPSNYKFNVKFQRHLFSSKMKLPTSNVKDLWFREIHKRKLYRFIHVGSAFF